MQITYEKVVTTTKSTTVDIPKFIVDAVGSLCGVYGVGMSSQKIAAIKLLRAYCHMHMPDVPMGLKEAKDAIEAFVDEQARIRQRGW